jgi:hypothetical protein
VEELSIPLDAMQTFVDLHLFVHVRDFFEFLVHAFYPHTLESRIKIEYLTKFLHFNEVFLDNFP